MKNYIIKTFGCDPDVIVKEEKADNTVENFINTIELATQVGAKELIIVTCENHMPRAKYICQAVLTH